MPKTTKPTKPTKPTSSPGPAADLDQAILIRCNRDIAHTDGSPRWRQGMKIATTEAELKARGVTPDAYTIVRRAAPTPAPAPAPAPGTSPTNDLPSA